MNYDEIAEAQRAIKMMQPCPFCGWVRTDSDTAMIHEPDCPLPKELLRIEAQEVE